VNKVVWHKAALPPYVDGSTVFARWCQYAPHLKHGSLDPHDSTQHPKLHLDWFSCFCRAHNRDRPTDRPHYSVRSNSLHLHSTAMPPNNNRVNRYHGVIDHIDCKSSPRINADSAADGCRPQTRQLSRVVWHLTRNDSSETTATVEIRVATACIINSLLMASKCKVTQSQSITCTVAQWTCKCAVLQTKLSTTK